MAKSMKNSSYTEESSEESSYQRYIRRQNKPALNVGLLFTIIAITTCFALAAFVAISLFTQRADPPDNRIKNVTIGGISLEGLTTSEASVLLMEHVNELLPTDEIIVTLSDQKLVLTNADTNAQLDVSAIATAAYLHGRNNKSSGDELLELDPYDFVKVDASRIRPLLKEFVQPFNGRPVETSIFISGECPDLTQEPYEGEPNQVLTIIVGTPTYLCDPDTLFLSIQSAHKNRTLELEGQLILIEPDAITAASIFYEYCVSAVNASIDPLTHILTESVYGYGFDIWSLQQQLNKAEWGDEIILPLSRIKPSTTTEMLSNSPS